MFVAVIRRPIRHQQDFRAGFGQCLTHLFAPCVFADGGTDAHRANRIRAVDRAGIIDAFFVKHGFIGQTVFKHARDDLAAAQDVIGVIKMPMRRKGATDPDRGTICTIARQLFNDGHRIGGKGRFHDHILHLIAGQEHFRQGQHIGARVLGCLPCLARLGGVAVEIPDGRVQLGKGQTELIGHGVLIDYRAGLSKPPASASRLIVKTVVRPRPVH